MTIFTPKVKIASGVILSIGSAYGIYKAFDSKNKNRIAHGVVGGILLLGGILLTRKGWVQNVSLNAMPMQEVDKSKKEISDIVKDAAKKGQVSSPSADGEATIVKQRVQSRQVQSSPSPQPQAIKAQSNTSEQNQWKNGKVVGKIDLKKIEESKNKKEKIYNQIQNLKAQHAQVIKKNGYNAGLPIRNEVAILKAQLFHI